MLSKILLAVFTALVFLLSFGILFAGVSVADSPTNETAEQGEYIDSNTELINATYNEKTGEATVTLRSETLQTVTLTDAGGFIEGGEIEQREVTLQPGEEISVSIPATETRGQVGVSIATQETLYAEIIEVPDYLFYEDPSWSTVQIAAFGSGLGVLVALGVDVARRKWWRKSEVSQFA